ncbi:PepSY domain-containing protein [Zhengella mangrovi]|nr:PepSY domain-containing protein [Zhengella mangrovi]
MTKSKTIAATVLAAALGAGLAPQAFAAERSAQADAQEMQALAAAKLSAGAAIDAALAQAPGKVSELQFNLENGVGNYEVSILGQDGAEHDFAVDTATGKVSVIAANEDSGQARDAEDDDGGQEVGETD